MDLNGIPMPKFDWESTNLPEQWRKFKSHVELIFDGSLKEKSEEVKVNYLSLWIGDKGREICETWTDLDGSGSEQATARKKLQTYYDRYQAHVQPRLNAIFTQYKFNTETQAAGTIEQFITKLRTLVKDCEYTNPDEMMCDREKLINEGDKLTLDKAIQIAQTHKYSQQQLKTMVSAGDEFQKKLDQSLEGLEGMVSIANDIIIHGKTRQEHDQRLHELLIRAKEKGIKFNKDKLEVGVTEVKYFGHLLTDKGLKPDPDKGKGYAIEVQVITSKHYYTSLLGLADSTHMGILNYDVDTANQLESNPEPVAPPAKLPIIKEALDKLIQPGQLVRVNEPTPWISKPAKVHICLDLSQTVNKAIIRPVYPIPTLEENIHRFHQAKVSSTFDIKDAFQTIQLTKESSMLTTMRTPWGHYCWTCLPFGISSAPDEFQRHIHDVLCG
ncbi:Hypothetical predicted protein [Paramuricea clavata]|uniref:Reverse transcriptase domain-containing protein n=1 Tax=Paramuricea clavata TaxID=317549 RepID=A0A7D9JN72_PARCT|nr:Hypothetical predicted protein [Paramuricea clavata]